MPAEYPFKPPSFMLLTVIPHEEFTLVLFYFVFLEILNGLMAFFVAVFVLTAERAFRNADEDMLKHIKSSS